MIVLWRNFRIFNRCFISIYPIHTTAGAFDVCICENVVSIGATLASAVKVRGSCVREVVIVTLYVYDGTNLFFTRDQLQNLHQTCGATEEIPQG